MLRILLDTELDSPTSDGLTEALQSLDADVGTWDSTSGDLYGVPDALIACVSRVAVVVEKFGGSPRVPQIVAVTPTPSPASTRKALLEGAAGLVDQSAHPKAMALAVLSTACGWTVVPAHHGQSLACRLSEPPRPLDPEESELLELIGKNTIEDAGRELGLSRRQIQRRFQVLCQDLGLQNHLHAAVTATAWGLLHDEGP